ncbi:ABC transporter permease [candidate division KSB1 bacterium]
MDDRHKKKTHCIAAWVLRLFYSKEKCETFLGDLEESFLILLSEKGFFRARLWYFAQLLKIMTGIFYNKLYWSFPMFKNYLKIALRNMKKNKGYSFINITGFALGLACFMSLMIYVQYEYSFDKFHKNSDEIHRIILEDKRQEVPAHYTSIPFPVGPAMVAEFPEIVSSTRLRGFDAVVKYNESIYNETGFLAVDPEFFKIFSFKFLSGSPDNALSEPNLIVISEKAAVKYFEDQDPIGKILTINKDMNFTVSGVVDLPFNTDFRADFFVTFHASQLFERSLDRMETNWSLLEYDTYLLLQERSSPSILEEKISTFLKEKSNREVYLELQKLNKVHLYNPDGSAGLIKNLYVFSLIAVFILVIACINFMNLSTARYEERSREVGLRKTVGAKRSQLIFQFFTESILLTFLSFVISVVLLNIALPYIRNFSGKYMFLDLSNIKFIGAFLFVVFFTGILAGSYPAVYLSSFEPVKAFKRFSGSGSSSFIRKFLVIFQYFLCIVLIVFSICVYSQMSFIQNKNVGFDKDNLVYVRLPGDSKNRHEALKKEFVKNLDVINAVASIFIPSEFDGGWAGFPDWEGNENEEKVYFSFLLADRDLIPTLNIEMKQGRNFSEEFSRDKYKYILNETAVKQMGLESPVGKIFNLWGRRGEIVGVVKDFHYRDFRNEVGPLVISPSNFRFGYRYIILRLKPGNTSRVIRQLRSIWININPGYVFDYRFFDEYYEIMYTDDQRFKKIIFYFALLSILISSLGLFGLTSFMVEKRRKEIGIRKALGASVSGVTFLLTSGFIKLVSIACLFALPVGYYFIIKWLQNFAYRFEPGWVVFLSAGLAALLVALLTVSFQTIRAALSNPVDSLRYE